ncbi:hypothetical protein AAGP30_25720, partial [Klebsiella pneumoniae]
MILSDCRQSYYIARNTGRNIMTLSDHQRAKSALNANDLNAAQGYLTGEKYNNRYRPVREGANKQVISSQADSLIKISRIWAD